MKWLHKLLKGASFATALFIFQACYGMPMDYDGMDHLAFTVIAEDTEDPLEGIEVHHISEADGGYDEMSVTDKYGHVVFFLNWESLADGKDSFLFRSADGAYMAKDTTFRKTPDSNVIIKLAKASE